MEISQFKCINLFIHSLIKKYNTVVHAVLEEYSVHPFIGTFNAVENPQSKLVPVITYSSYKLSFSQQSHFFLSRRQRIQIIMLLRNYKMHRSLL